MACITGGKRCERILTGDQTALNWGCFYILALAVVGCFREFSVMRVLSSSDRIVVGITEVSREIYRILLVCGSNAGLSASEI